MDLMAAIGLLSSIVTLEEAGRSWVLIVKDKLKRKEIDINNWDSDDPLVQACLDRFKTDMGDKYKDHIFSEEEIQEIIRGFFEQNRELRIGNEEKKQMTQIIEDILYAYNEHTKSLMSSGERTLHNTLSSDFSKIMDKLGVIEEQPHKENIKKFLRCIYRRYQIWISNKLFVQEAREKFVYTLLTDNSIEAKWKKQTEIGIVKSKYCGLFFKEFQELLDETVVALILY